MGYLRQSLAVQRSAAVNHSRWLMRQPLRKARHGVDKPVPTGGEQCTHGIRPLFLCDPDVGFDVDVIKFHDVGSFVMSRAPLEDTLLR